MRVRDKNEGKDYEPFQISRQMINEARADESTKGERGEGDR